MPSAINAGTKTPRAVFAAALAVFVVAVGVYLPKLRSGFNFDDRVFIQTDPALRSLPDALKQFGHDQARLYRPLRSLALAALIRAFGLDSALPFQAAGLLFHALLSAMVVGLAWRLARDPLAALLAGLIFALHPVHADRVANVTGSFDLLGLVFAYAAWLGALRYDRRGGGRHLLGAAAMLALGCLASEETLTVWVWLAAFFVLRGTRSGRGRRVLFALGAVIAAYLIARTVVLSGVARTAHYAAGGLSNSLLTTVVIVWRYVGLLFWPVGLTPAYGPTIYRSLSLAPALGLAGLIALAVIALALRRRAPAFALGVLWFLVMLLPFANLLPSDTLMAERYLYSPLGGFALAAGWGGAQLARRRRAAAALLVLALTIYGAATAARAQTWGDPLRLWRQAAQREPRSFLANVNAAYHLIRVGRLDEARPAAERARRLGPRRAEPLTSLAEIAFREKHDQQGVQLLLQAVKIDPTYCPAQAALAQAFVKIDDPVSATLAADQALACDPRDPTANFIAGYLSYLGRRCDLTRRYLHVVVSAEPRVEQYDAAVDMLARCRQ